MLRPTSRSVLTLKSTAISVRAYRTSCAGSAPGVLRTSSFDLEWDPTSRPPHLPLDASYAKGRTRHYATKPPRRASKRSNGALGSESAQKTISTEDRLARLVTQPADSQSLSVLRQLPLEKWKDLLKTACGHRISSTGPTSSKPIDSLVSHLVDCASRQQEKYQDVIIDALSFSTEGPNSARDDQVFDLFHCLPPTMAFPGNHTSASVARIFEAMLNDEHFSVHLPFLQTAYPLLITPPPDGSSPVIVPDPARTRALQALFQFMGRLMYQPTTLVQSIPPDAQTERRRLILAIEIFSALTSANSLPRSITNIAYQTLNATVPPMGSLSKSDANVERDSITTVLLQALVLTCFKWDWKEFTLEFLSSSWGLKAWTRYKELTEHSAGPGRQAGSLTQRATSMKAPAFMSLVKSNFIHQLVLNLLGHPSNNDVLVATALIEMDTETARPACLLQRLQQATVPANQPATIDQIRCFRLSDDKQNASHASVPDYSAWSSVARLPDTQPNTDLVAELLRNSSRLQEDTRMTATTVPDLPARFLVHVAQNRGIPPLWAYEFWRRANESCWKGLPRLSLCGSLEVVSAIVQRNARPGLHALALQVPDSVHQNERKKCRITAPNSKSPIKTVTRLDFAKLALGAFENIRLKRPGKPDVAASDTFTRLNEIVEQCQQEALPVSRLPDVGNATARSRRQQPRHVLKQL